MRQSFRIEITGEIPDGDSDMGAHVHVAAVKPVLDLMQTLQDMGLRNVVKEIRLIRIKAPNATARLPPVAKIVA